MRPVTLGAIGAAAGAAHAIVNARLLRTPPADPPPVGRRVSVLLPVRDEAHRVEPALRSLLAQHRLADVELLVLDDGSTDGTGDLVRRVCGDRARVIDGEPLPPGWLGKPWACSQLAAAATGDVLVFVDADVVLEPPAIAATLALLDETGLDFASPYPRQLADGLGPRLVQPMLQWSWLTFLPLRLAERSSRRSLAAANGQLLAVRRGAYYRAGGHRAVRDEILDDIALARALKAAGATGGIVDGTAIATCRMYDGWADLRTGYTKSLWSAGGHPLLSTVHTVFFALLYVLPPVAALRGSRAGAAGYAAGVAGRVVSARRTGARAVPDAFAHPLSVALLGWLTAQSWRGRRRGTLGWKGRRLP